MIIIREAERFRRFLGEKATGKSFGFVPTMGALHAGHLTLLHRSKRETDKTICSIFVNPTQFNDPADFSKYPITLEDDIRMLEMTGVDILFLPDVHEIYPEGTASLETYDLGRMDQLLEGRQRPGHFQGVCQVVHRLLSVTRPDVLFMGRKDFQQCMVIRRLIHLKSIPVRLEICDTVREADGLAMSSRNMRLSPDDRSTAPILYDVLNRLKRGLDAGPLESRLRAGREALAAAGFRVDYLEICRTTDLEPVTEWDGHTPITALAAAFLGEVRLIDNIDLTA
jgi:pantoate--beta-alanine ligase